MCWLEEGGRMSVKVKCREGVDVLRCHEELNAAEMVSIKHKVTRLLNKRRKHVVLDFSRTQHVDFAGLGILVERIKKMRSINGDIKLCNVNSHVSETFRLVGVSKLIEEFPSKVDAVRSFHVA
jgi:anti-anti-sigma factor